MLNVSARWACAALSAASLSACTCGAGLAQRVPGELVVLEATGAVASTLVVDFGAVTTGESVTRPVTLQNRGQLPITLQPFTSTGDAVGPQAGFRLSQPETIAPGESARLDATFAPDQPRDFSAVVTLESADASEGARQVTLSLMGRVVDGKCDLPAVLDFGNVALNSTRVLSLTLENPRDEVVEARVGQASGGAMGPFTRESPTQERLVVRAKATAEVRVSFRPTTAEPFLSSMVVKPAPSCPERTVRLVGTGVAEALWVRPNPVDFGFAPIGQVVTRELTFTNASTTALSVALTWPAAEFSGPATVTVPAFGEEKAVASFRPAMLGARSSTVAVRTSTNSFSVPLRGGGGGPDVDVRPAAVSFGRVPFFPANTPAQTRRLQVLNVGTRATTQAAERLFLGRAKAPPYAELRSPDGGTASEFSLVVSPTPAYSDSAGLEARAGQYLGLEVRLAPTSVGARSADLVVFSSDLDEPEVHVPVTANVVALPPCTLRVTPSGLVQFGSLTPQVPTTRQVVFENLSSTDMCLVSELAITPSSHPAFALRAGPVTEKELRPLERWTVELTATSSGVGTGTITGELRYWSSSATPEGVVQLSASLDPACLTISPIELDVGAVKLGCASATRSFTLFNSCAGPVVIRDLSLLDGAGLPANTPPLCPTAAACPELTITQRPTVPLTLASAMAPVTVTVAYRPVDVGLDVGALAVTFEVAGQPRTQVVAIRGEGNTSGVVTDVFQGAGIPRVDILFVIDGSCSMSSKQMSLASNLPSYFAQALSTNVDYHLAVVVGQGPPSVPSRGAFRVGATHPVAILTKNVPDAEAQFAARVTSIGSQGGNEECFQPALEALTPPLSTGSNAGFLRAGAQLAVVCVTDDSDYSPQPVAFYQAALTNLKSGRQTDVSVSAIAGYTQSCSATQLENGRYATMTTATGGVREEICTTDWAQALTRLSLTTFGQSGRYFLRAAPDLMARALEVRVDGTLVSPTSAGRAVWRFETLSNAVVFEELFRPQPGARVEVTYQPACF